MHQPVHGARDEAVVDEDVLFDRQRGVVPLEIAGAIALDAQAQREVLRARRRPDWIRLHETEGVECIGERRGWKQAASHREAAHIGQGRHGQR